jgi:hypothetical protein
MKKQSVMVLAMFAIVNMAFAQGRFDYSEKLTFGVKGGLNLSNVYDTKGEQFDADAKFGFVAGAFMSIPLGKVIGVQPEILISQKGFQATGVLLGAPYSFTRTTTYIDVPLLFAIKPFELLTLLAGPQYSYLQIQKDVFGSATTSVDQETQFKNDNIRKNTLCFTGGADLNLDHVVVGARLGWDLFNNNGDGTSTTPRYKNVWYQGTIGFRF